MLTLTNIGKRFKKKHGAVDAVHGLTMSVEKGEFISITGPSGSGKSTLLLMLGGMTTPTSGTVKWNDCSLYDMTPTERAAWRETTVGFIFQAFNLIPYLNVRENVGLALNLTGNHPADAEKRIDAILEKVGLTDRQDHLPNELSIGQQQRVALARALVKAPTLILADEPTGNLDRDTAAEVLTILKELNRDGKTVILITHDPSIAQMAKRTIRIVEGRIKQVNS